MPLVNHSFTAYDTFVNKCERQVFFKNVKKLREPPSHYLAIGNLYHDAVADLLRAHASIPSLEDAIERALVKAKADRGWTCDVDDDTLRKEVLANLKRVVTEVFPYLQPRVLPGGQLFVEQWGSRLYKAKLDVLSETTPLVNEHGEIIGKLDEPCIVDWKTVFSAKRRSQANTDTAAQLALYAIETGVKNACFVEIPRSPLHPINVIATSFEAFDLQRWQKHFDVQFAALDTRGPEEAAWKLAAPSMALCSPKWCPFWKVCPGGGT